MIERQDAEAYVKSQQDLQIIAEMLFQEMLQDRFDLQAFLSNPRGYTRAFMAECSQAIFGALAKDAVQAGLTLASK